MVLPKLSYWSFSGPCYRAAMKMKNIVLFLKQPYLIGSSNQLFPYPSLTNCSLYGRESQTFVCDISTLLRSQSFFPYFMLVAFEGGSIFRAFFLLLSCPFLLVLNFECKLRVMIFITFCGLRFKDMDVVAKAVLPKFYLENLNLRVYEVLASAGSRLVFTGMPRVMVEEFLKEYLSVDTVKGTELHSIGQFFTGFISNSGLLVKDAALKEFCGEKRPDIGIGTLTCGDLKFISHCKEAYVVNKQDRTCAGAIMPREKYPKPLIFHDGRLAFFPTPLSTLTMFMWLPFGIMLSMLRLFVSSLLPNKMAIFLLKCSGVIFRFEVSQQGNGKAGVLYVCNHRTLVDPVIISLALGKSLTALTYSLSRFSELIARIRTVRLTRDRNKDAETIRKLLSEGDLILCPEGTTCREPYLLRFSSLFAELTDDIVPVAVNTKVTLFYGTTANGLKWLDPIFFCMNPRLYCSVQVLDKVPKQFTVAAGKSSHEVANYIQRQLAHVLEFECTNLTRKEKYMQLAGNEGLVQESKRVET